MKNLRKENGTILEFHIGRGGRFHNPGFLTFQGSGKSISETPAFNYLYPPLFKNGNDNFRTLDSEWRCESGDEMGLTNRMVKSGIGIINIDNEYDTTYTTYARDMSDDELKKLIDVKPWNIIEILEEYGYNSTLIRVLENFGKLEEIIEMDYNHPIDLHFEVSESEPENVDFIEIDGKYYFEQ